MRFKGKHRVSKQELKEDRFQKFTEKAVAAYYRDRQKFWIGAGVVVVAIVGIILLLQNRGSGVNSQAEVAFTEAIGVYSTGNMEQSEQAFKQVSSRFGREFVGVKARYYLGNVYYNTGRYDEAKKEFAAFLSRVKNDPLLSPAAQLGIGNSEEQLGNNPKAAQAYEAVLQKYPKSPLAYEAAMGAGRAYRAAGMLDKAEAVYKKLADQKLQGEKGEEVKLQLAAIEAAKKKF